MYLKIVRADDTPPIQGGIAYKNGKIYTEDNFCEDPKIECGRGLYFIEPYQLPLWGGKDRKIKVVKILGKKIMVSKGGRTNKLKIIRDIKPSELAKIEKQYGFSWENRTQTAGYRSTQTAGDSSTQTAGCGSTQTAGCSSTLIIYGDISYIIKKGNNCILRQIWWEENKYKSIIIDLDKLLKKYKIGDKVKIVKGKISPDK